MTRKMVDLGVHIRPDQRLALNLLSKRTRIPMSVIVREALDQFLSGDAVKPYLSISDDEVEP